MTFIASRRIFASQAFCRLWRIAGVVALLASATGAAAQTWSGPSFREFVGNNNAGSGDALFTNTVSWNRHEVSWGNTEPAQGVWDLGALASAGQEILTLQARNARLLPILAYTVLWAMDRSSREWTLGNDKWAVAPGDSGSMIYSHYNVSTGALISTSTISDSGNLSKFPPANVSDWTAYVQKVVSYLHASPYNQQYFQIWNEAQEISYFWYGSMDDYMQRVHLPAAQVIHAAGAKVVYGGWPDSGSITELIDVLTRNNAWGSIDVIDTHYIGTNGAFAQLRAAADAHGRSDLAIWQTEIGFTTDCAYVPASYTKRLDFCLHSNWTRDKYKAFYFANFAPDASDAYGYHCCLYTGSVLYAHGRCLQALGNLLGNTATLNLYPGITSSPAMTDNLTAPSAMECFATGNTIVIATNLGTADYTGLGTVKYTLPINRTSITKAERVDIVGTRLDITSSLAASGSSTTLSGVNVLDPAGSDARTWNDATANTRVFYVVVTLNGPAVSKFETENLAVAAQSAGVSHRVAADPSFSDLAGTLLDSTAAGQFVTYIVPGVASATYDVRVGVKNSGARGTFQLAVSRADQLNSPSNVGSAVDQYSASPAYTEIDLGTWTPGSTSDKGFRFNVSGKNAASTGYTLGLDYITLIRR